MLIDAALITCATALTAQLLISTFADDTTASAGPDRQAVPGIAEEADRQAIAISPSAGSGEGFLAQAMSLQIIDRLPGSPLDHGGLVVVSRSDFDPSRRAEQTTSRSPRVPTRPGSFARSSDAPSILAANL